MRLIFSLSSFFILTSLNAEIVNVGEGDVYQGFEYKNERPTGLYCYLFVKRVEPSPRGMHCTLMNVQPIFSSKIPGSPDTEWSVLSSVTNYHRREYPERKTCAMTIDGHLDNDDIYSEDTTNIYNRLFSSMVQKNGVQFDFFVKISPENKEPFEFRLHRLSFWSESSWDCLHLKRMN